MIEKNYVFYMSYSIQISYTRLHFIPLCICIYGAFFKNRLRKRLIINHWLFQTPLCLKLQTLLKTFLKNVMLNNYIAIGVCTGAANCSYATSAIFFWLIVSWTDIFLMREVMSTGMVFLTHGSFVYIVNKNMFCLYTLYTLDYSARLANKLFFYRTRIVI